MFLDEATIAVSPKPEEAWRGHLRGAAQALRKHGHTKNILANSRMQMCALGAIGFAANNGDPFSWRKTPESHRAVQKFGEYLRRTVSGNDVPMWPYYPGSDLPHLIANWNNMA